MRIEWQYDPWISKKFILLKAKKTYYLSFEKSIFFMFYISQKLCLFLIFKLLKLAHIYILPSASFRIDTPLAKTTVAVKKQSSSGLRGCWLGYSQGPPPFTGPPISKSVKKSTVWTIHNTVPCNRYHRQSGLISRRSVLTRWKSFVEVKVVDSLACGLADTH